MSYIFLYQKGQVTYIKTAETTNLKKVGVCTLSFDIFIVTDKIETETEISTLSELPVDACFAPNKWEHVIAQADVYASDSDTFCLLVLNDCDGEKINIKNVKFSEPLGELFDGGRLYQIFPAYAQSMGYVYITKRGKVVVVDGGGEKDKDELTSLIMEFGGVVEHMFITHYHSDHICAIIELFKENKVKVKNLYYDFPSEEILALAEDDGDNRLVKEFTDAIPKGVNIITPKKGDTVKIDELTVTVLNDACFEIRSNFCNDSSILYKFNTGKSKILFTGDLGAIGDEYIKDKWFRKEISDCNVVQMAHHGQNGTSKAFYDCIDKIEVCLYPAPWWLWNGWDWGTPKTRSWMRERGVLKSIPCVPAVTIEIK